MFRKLFISPVQRQARPIQVEPLTSIIVPVMNEAANVMPLVKRIYQTLQSINNRPAEVLFVDDSKDTKTVQAITLAKMAYDSAAFTVRVYHRTGDNRWGGLSGAVTDGFNKAVAQQIIVMDGDLQHPPETIASMIKAAESYDMVVASRYREGGSANGLDGGLRHLVSRSSTLLAKAFFPLRLRPVSDPMTGFFLVNKQLIDTTNLRPKGFKILLEILGTHPKITVTEVPLQFAERLAGESHGDLKQGLAFLSQLITLRINSAVTLFNRLPKFVRFGAIGGSVFAIGMAMLYVLVAKFNWNPLAANALQLVVTFTLNYVLNKRLTWGDRSITRSAANKFFVSRAATTVINYYLFAGLIHIHGVFTVFGQAFMVSVNYLVANIVALFGIMALNYVISDKWAFANKSYKTNTSALKSKATQRFPIGKTLTILILAAVALGVRYNVIITLSALLAAAGLAMFAQASVEVWRMMYAYRQPDAVDKLKFPVHDIMQERFCVIVPARHEAEVLGDTLRQ